MEKMFLLSLVCCIGTSLALNSWELPETDLLSFVNAELNHEWMLFKKSYNKTYTDSNEEIRRRLYWEDTMQFIKKHNLKYDRGQSTYTLGENGFADMAEDEMEKKFLRGLILPEVEEEYHEALTEPDPEVDPLQLDWRMRGWVTPIKNQGRCASGWAFAAIGALEGQVMKKTGHLIELSEQNLIDCCASKWGNYGCRGGWMNNAYTCMIETSESIDSETCYPYKGLDQSCRFRIDCSQTINVIGVRNVGKSEASFKSALASVGPLAMAMDVNHRSFWYYRNGVYNERRCNGYMPNHAMTAVGYGSCKAGDYWILKNSWGNGWGAKGYVYVARNKGDNCGVTKWGSYPIIA